MSEEMQIETHGKSLIVRFTRPEIRSPLSLTVIEHLNEIADRCSSDAGIKNLIFTGTGSSFASGADLREIAAVTSESAADFARKGQQLMTKIEMLSQRTFASINGFCFGGALDLALACDRRIASQNAKFAHPGAGLGIITGWGGTQRLPRLIGTAIALEMFFTATAIDAQRALSIGLIDEIADDPLAAVLL